MRFAVLVSGSGTNLPALLDAGERGTLAHHVDRPVEPLADVIVGNRSLRPLEAFEERRSISAEVLDERPQPAGMVEIGM